MGKMSMGDKKDSKKNSALAAPMASQDPIVKMEIVEVPVEKIVEVPVEKVIVQKDETRMASIQEMHKVAMMRIDQIQNDAKNTDVLIEEIMKKTDSDKKELEMMINKLSVKLVDLDIMKKVEIKLISENKKQNKEIKTLKKYLIVASCVMGLLTLVNIIL